MAILRPKRDYTFRAFRWRGNLDDLPADWHPRVTVDSTGLLVISHTHQGPAAATPDGEWWIAESPDPDELYTIRDDVKRAKYDEVAA